MSKSKWRTPQRRSEHHRTFIDPLAASDPDAVLNRAARRLMKHAAKRPHKITIRLDGVGAMRDVSDAHIRR